jgi:hypothetical protein
MVATRTAVATRPAVRVRPVPPLDPPFDDEPSATGWPAVAVGQLALDLVTAAAVGAPVTWPAGRVRASAPGTPPAGGRAGDPGAAGGRAQAVTTDGGPATAPVALGATDEARRAAHRFLTFCLEIVNGYRPVGHVRPRVDPGELSTVTARLTSAAQRLARPGQRPRPGDTVRPRRVRVCEPRPGVAEVAAVLHRDGRCWAMAFRLERRQDGHWIARTVELL